MNKRRLIALVSAVLMLTVVFAGCKSEDKNVIKIGGLAPLTGEVAQYGEAVINAVKLAIEEINKDGGILGKQIKFICYDEKGDATEALNAYNRLVDEGIVALVGDVTSKPTKAVAQKAVEDNMPMITPSATEESITQNGENVFRTCFIDPYQGRLMAHYAKYKLGASTVAILYDIDDTYSKGIADAFEASAKGFGMTVTNKEGYASKSTDFNSQLTKIINSNPDVLMIPVYYNDVALIVGQAKAHGLKAKLLGADGWDGVLEVIDKSNVDALANAYFCSQYSATDPNPAVQDFLKKYKETYNKDANMFAVLGYDSMYILADAIERAGSTEADKIIEALRETNYNGLTGITTFDENRNPVRQAIITSFEGNSYKVIEGYSMD
ncbi:MAG TPA: ABC transporter substrate-binding protein [Candidatus Avimonas sp.]|jgi:branched-chain amino acid transport system substrate-binding protein|nr:ABC transporter substrate-binding protein [Clostridiales bacterium]HOB36307.1 ABC transporter substrate-binding protein [Candidatus Avimonas sp.]HQA15854.1 ABC transporter substrate-binding protein [Candidatus Avimonas sp.]HQD37760.1 ABC transporter substrate-binding protein [Candidatus Avimonas sp.]